MVTMEIGSLADVLVHLVYHSLYITKEAHLVHGVVL